MTLPSAKEDFCSPFIVGYDGSVSIERGSTV